MQDFIAIVGCVLSTSLCLWILSSGRCQHYEFDPCSLRCWWCGISYRDALRDGLRSAAFRARDQPTPYSEFGWWTMRRVREDGRLAEEYLPDDAPQELKNRLKEYHSRRYGRRGVHS